MKLTTGLSKEQRSELIAAKNAAKMLASADVMEKLLADNAILDTLEKCDSLAKQANALNLEQTDKNLVRDLIRGAKQDIKEAAKKEADKAAVVTTTTVEKIEDKVVTVETTTKAKKSKGLTPKEIADKAASGIIVESDLPF